MEEEKLGEKIMGKLVCFTEYQEEIDDALEKAPEIFENASKLLSDLSPVFTKCAEVVDMVAPWLGPIGIGLKLATCGMSFFMDDIKSNEEKLGELNLKINKIILKGINEILANVKMLILYVKFE